MKQPLILAACAALAACSTAAEFDPASVSRNAPQITGPSPYVTTTPAAAALACVAKRRAKGQDLRIGIGEIVDGTGARTFTDGTTPLLTQRPDMMFAVALKKTGLRALNRNATKVAEWEMAQSMQQRLGEGHPTEVEGKVFPYRPVEAGSMLGSTHFVTGALTEVNWNIYSDDKQTTIAGAFAGNRTYYISVALDLMVTDTRTTEVLLAQSYTKQIVGREVSKGLFRFFEVDEGGSFGPVELFDASAGEQRNEPVQQAVRWLVDVATYDIAATLTRTKAACDVSLAPPPVAAAETVPAAKPAPATPQPATTSQPASAAAAKPAAATIATPKKTSGT